MSGSLWQCFGDPVACASTARSPGAFCSTRAALRSPLVIGGMGAPHGPREDVSQPWLWRVSSQNR